MNIQAKIKDLEDRVRLIENKLNPRQNVFLGYIRSDGSKIYEVGQGNNKEYLNKEEFDRYIDSLKYDKDDNIIILDFLTMPDEVKVKLDTP